MEVFIGILVIVLLVIVIMYNNFVSLKKSVEHSKKAIDIYLKERFDLIPNLVDCVKGYMNYEKDVLEKLVTLREDYIKSDNINEANMLNKQYDDILVRMENYPELKASDSFIQLEQTLTKLEGQIQAARRLYNSDATIYNTRVDTVPFNLVACIFKFEKVKLLEFEPEIQNNVKIDF